MANFHPRKLEADARRDVISELPADLKERILECLPIRDAARTALLSTHWKNAWLRLGRLAFDWDFLKGVRESKGDIFIPFVKIITYILFQRVRPVKKFSLLIKYLSSFDPKLELSDLDQWFLFLSRNGVEELDICDWDHQYTLPFCIFLCPTIKQLRLYGVGFDCPINSPCIFPCVTSLAFGGVVFNDNVNGIVYSIPNLEKLDFDSCIEISNFKISAPKLESLSIIGGIELRWLALHLERIKVLRLDNDSLLLNWEDVEVASLPTAINLQVIKLYSLKFANEKQVMGILKLFKNIFL